MSILNQKTLNKAVTFKGVGLHTGKKVTIKVLPASPNSGISIIRTDLKNNNLIFPSVFNVSDANYCTTVSNDHGIKVSTIEHLMAALFIKGIDNAVIESDAEEFPILDGSSKNFVSEIEKIGIKHSDVPIKIIKINKEINFKDGVKEISISPTKINLEIDFEIKYSNPIIGTQKNVIKVYEDNLEDITNSRTFCLYEDIEKLKEMNLARGGSLDNAIVVKRNKILNSGGLRNPKEFVNHKILDCIGDLYLMGYRMIGRIRCTQGGHKLTNSILRKLLEDKKNYSLLEIKDKNLPTELIQSNFLKSIA